MSNNSGLTQSTAIKALGWNIIERFFSQGVNLLIQVVLARILLPEDFGSLAIMVALINYANVFVQSGLGTALIQKKEIDKFDVYTLFSGSFFVAFVMYVFIYVSSPWIGDYYHNHELILPLRVLSLVLFLNSINAIQTALLSRNMDFKSLCLRSVLAVPVSGIVGIIMAYNGFGLWALVSQVIINNMLIVIFMSMKPELRLKWGFSFERAKILYSFSIKILLTSLVTGFHDSFRSMIIAKKYSRNDLAYFDKAVTYSGYATQIFTQALTSVLLPAFSRKQDNLVALKKASRRSISMITFVMLPVLFTIAIFSKDLIEVILTEKWVPCVPYLIVYCFLRIPGCLVVSDKQIFYALGKSSIMLYYEISLLIVNLTVLYFTMNISPFAIAFGAMFVEYIGLFVIWCISMQIYNYSIQERLSDIFRPFLYLILLIPFKFITVLENNILNLLLKILLSFAVYNLIAFIANDPNQSYILNLIKSKLKKGEFNHD